MLAFVKYWLGQSGTFSVRVRLGFPEWQMQEKDLSIENCVKQYKLEIGGQYHNIATLWQQPGQQQQQHHNFNSCIPSTKLHLHGTKYFLNATASRDSTSLTTQHLKGISQLLNYHVFNLHHNFTTPIDNTTASKHTSTA